MTWCDFCQGHYEVAHHGPSTRHRVGTGFGPVGYLLAVERAARAMVGSHDGGRTFIEAYVALDRVLSADMAAGL